MKSNILFVTTHFAPDYHFGGVVESGTKLLRNLRGISGQQINLICVSKSPNKTNEENIICKSLFMHSWGFSFNLIYYLISGIRQSDIIYINGIVTFPTTLASCISIFLGKPFIVCIRGGLEPWRRNHKKWKKFLYFKYIVYPLLRKSSKIHVTCNEEYRTLTDLGFRNIFISSNGIDIEEFGPIKAPTLHNDTFQFLFLSRTDKEKGIDILLAAYKLFTEKYGSKSTKLLIIGPDNSGYLSKKNIDFSKRNILHSHGVYNEAKINLIKSVDVLILPSYSENFGNVIAESLACGTPVVTTTGTPWKEIEKVGCGFVVEPEVIPLFEAMERIFLLDRSSLISMGVMGREYIVKNFLWTSKAEQVLSELREI